MAKPWHIVCLWSVCYFQVLNISAFNLDTENVLQRSGNPGSLFGFSVAFHQQLSPTRKKLWVETSYARFKCGSKFSPSLYVSHCLRCFALRLLVGAPRSKHLNQVNVTGVVYQCDLTTTSEHCQPIRFDNEGLFAYSNWNYTTYLGVFKVILSYNE